MLQITARQAMLMMNARLLNPGSDTGKEMPEVAIDSRELAPGQAFFALVGERLDGHDFLPSALLRKPGLAVLSDPSSLRNRRSRKLQSDRIWSDNRYDGTQALPFLLVPDTTVALQDLARGLRNLWGGPVIGITGSMGKTTTRHYISGLLERTLRVHSTSGNFNNHIGLPLSLTRLEEAHQVSVLEMGMNHAGEIRLLGNICRPDTAVITNVAPVHLQFFASLERIAEAKAEIIETIKPGGSLVYNGDDELATGIAQRFPGRKLSFGFSKGCDIRISEFAAEDLENTAFSLTVAPWSRTITLRLKATGKPGAMNLAAAVAAALPYGLAPEILADAAPRLSAPDKRGKIFETRGITVWDDSYNSNPMALAALLESVRGLRNFRRLVLVLGDMLELGERSPEFHEECGRRAAESGAGALFTVGKEALMISRGAYAGGLPADNIFSFASSAEAAEPVRNFVCEGDLVVVKGSRAVRMETIIEKLKEEK